ncbi:mannose-6-phosphate isomerase, class I [Vibrio breoganii]|uniref:mannose-6-phosphate isomerase, class I n=1 Tax=Vibrio breoganii TaxID=553239 RepID=UPI000C81744B|nr:mannose-6-phosphate isomerase, class I [Vibrio breoganii]PMG35993.1 mannose-6-phosphate isomerase, class I [Vibrio breoganii]PML54648.1 mannose-6-phosphate isomerase, class I [Vibrio breoganii]PMM49048.1 mannose-6-phosphate isomerase, class I [Vibrio breoganii]PMP05094.1 mannose-6-phosphate isomerase, class I [Vibrio breoganii]
MIYKLNNVIQNYAWGSHTSLSSLFGFDNPNNEPQAELWMGAHPNGCSKLAELDISLADYIKDNSHRVLGDYTANRYGQLPYLFKVLAARTPLSIQVHPNKRNSEIGFERENAQGIALSAGHRNYKDPNHKPELVYAITVYKAMNGFRPITDIIALFDEVNIEALSDDVAALKQAPDSHGLKALFTTVLTLTGDKKDAVLKQLSRHYGRTDLSTNALQALAYCQNFANQYPSDNGILAPLLLNIVELQPGEAMFLHAETPHAYVQGTALEIMASSDNVLRAGLTPKHIDVEELVANTRFESIKPNEILLEPIKREGYCHFPVPVDDFKFDLMEATDTERTLYARSAEILFCIEGELRVSFKETLTILGAGESALVPCSVGKYAIQGKARVARAYN